MEGQKCNTIPTRMRNNERERRGQKITKKELRENPEVTQQFRSCVKEFDMYQIVRSRQRAKDNDELIIRGRERKEREGEREKREGETYLTDRYLQMARATVR